MELNDLYQELIIDHGTQPRNCQALNNATHTAEGYNPLCGDQVKLYLKIENGRILDAGFQGKSCVISTASTSLMTESLTGKTIEEAQQLLAHFQEFILSDQNNCSSAATANTNAITSLGKLHSLAGVRAYPARIKCATLPWHALQAALKQKSARVSTE